jgi:DNA-binding transcriptional ArsR family regulator
VQRAAQQWHDKYEKHREEWDHPLPDAAQLLNDKAAFVTFMNHAIECENADGIWEETFELYQQPTVLVERIQQHIHSLWDNFLREEWERALPMLQESLNAFQRLDYSNITLLDALRTVTGRDMASKLRDYEHTVEQVVFTPSPHLGPYITRYPDGETLRVLYGARLPRGAQAQSPAFSRAEVLVRMNALADDTRLRILEMLTRTDELCAQDIIETLGLSQSTVSRHLGQLTASGFLVERRRDVNKCYSLNTDRVVDTVRALTNFLTRQ